MSTTATLNYIKPLPVGIKPYTWIDAPPAGMPSTNTAVDAHRVLIADVRSLPEAERPTLEDNGGTFLFGAGVGSGQEMNWDDDEEVKRKYYPELEEVLKKQTGAAKVVIYDHTVRRPTKAEDDVVGPKNRHPVSAVHIDQSFQAGINRMHKHISPEDLPDALAHRAQLINVWRPINGIVVEDFPLAIADANTVREEDKVASDLISSAYATGENLRVLYSDSHRWFYLAHQAPNEFILLKCFDSARPDKIVPHTAFANEDARKGAPGRQSIEARCLVLYDH